MKRFRILSVLLALVIGACLALTACGKKQDGGSVSGSESTEQGGGSVTPSGDVLVVYFSATNNTEKIAGYIADITEATQFELVPQVPYSNDDLNYNNRDSRVSKEYADQSLRDIPLEKSTPDNWETFETVFIGYPIWWGIAAWPVNGFIKDNDFTGKTVIPFCTSASSPLGESAELLAQMAGTGNWKEGKRFPSSASKGDVEQWISLL